MTKNILLVEDEAITQMLEKKQLQDYGYEVTTALTGEEAIDIVKNNEYIDLILMDIDLGSGIDGTETANEILKLKNLPIVFLSSHTERDIVEKTEKITSYGYVVKNSGIVVLDASIKMAFKLFNAQSKLEKELNERKVLEAKLIQEEKRTMTWLQNLPICTKIIDTDYNLQFMSQPGFEMLQLSYDDGLFGKPYPFSFFPEDFRETMINSLNESKSSKKDTFIKGRANDVKGNSVWLQSKVGPILDENGEVEYFIVSTFDITKLMINEQYLERSIADLEKNRKELEIIQKATYSVLEDNSFKETSKKIFSYAKEITEAKSGYVALLNEDGSENEIVYLDSGGLPCTVDPELPMPIRGLREVAYQTSKAVFHNDFMNSEWIKYMPKGHVILKNVMFAPLVIDEKTVGILGLANKDKGFNKEDLEAVSKLAAMATIALINSRARENLRISENALHEALEYKDSLMKDMNHRMKNNFMMVESLIKLKQLNSKIEIDFDDLYNRIEVFRMIHEMLYQETMSKYDMVSIPIFLHNILEGIRRSCSCPVQINSDIMTIELPSKKATNLGLIVNEIATNAVKHGYPEGGMAIIDISLKKDSNDKSYILSIHNRNGKPFPNDICVENPVSMGLQLINSFVKNLQGTLELVRSPEPIYTISFKE